jgi:hypothetical protein
LADIEYIDDRHCRLHLRDGEIRHRAEPKRYLEAMKDWEAVPFLCVSTCMSDVPAFETTPTVQGDEHVKGDDL